ncbi:MAG: T9SS sorting signal type C domain-containing protein [Flavobacterium sp.]|uniref:T9SS sorting signal type C domain-containing protein n=1 Tax=Flavobacterium sp. TaxID=239 RepID=UPI0022BBF9AB|nr:T9SS sorting signal type C domain-containing protein [Flavobacterium sp.]MCZ8196935.1 T9SS sorting signal type C domain-containing protein [Flavobacterium sp.]
MNNFTQFNVTVKFNKFLTTVGLLLALFFGNASFGQINITAGGSAVTQNFNAIVGSPGTLPTEWTAQANTTERTITNFSASASTIGQVGGNSMSTSATAGIYRYNANNVTSESAIGGLSSGSANKTVTLYTRLRNNAATAIGNFTISYNVEKFRNGSNAAGFSIELFYSTNGTFWTSCGADFTTSFAADANNNGFATSPGSTVAVTSKTYTPSVAIAQNGVVYFAWRYSVTSGATTSNAQALGVDDISITANASISAPTVTTTSVSAITTTSASSGGDVTADGGATVSARGVAFGTSANPTTGTSNGSGTGTFTSSLTSLSPNTQYFYRAYATNSVNTAYGTESSFYTSANTPNAVTVANPQTSTLDVTIATTDGNPTSTEYAIQETTGSLYVQANGSLGASAVWQTAATWATKTVIGLTGNTTYTFQTKARNGANAETAFGATASGTTLAVQTVDWCNIQPLVTNTFPEGGSTLVYARVYEGGITNAAGEGTAIDAWIGYSPTNGTPDNTWTWVAAPYFGDDGSNNDEYSTTIGSGLTPGTYYVVSRFSINGGTFVYGGVNNNIWSSTADSAVMTVTSNVVDFANVQFPTSGTITQGDNFNVYAKVYEPGVTNTGSPGSGITAWIGYSSSNINPNSGSWTWVPATFNADQGNDDEYVANIGSSLTPGVYYYASRFQKTGSSQYVYGGTAGVWNNDNGTLTVNQAIPVVTTATPSGTYNVVFSYNIVATNAPTSYAISSGTLPTGLSLNTTTGEITGTPTAAGSFSVDVTATNGGGTSLPATLSFTIAKANQTITFGALASATTATAPFALTGTASSGLTVTYASSNTAVATISGNTVTIVAPGTTTITASQAGDTNYNPATVVNQNLVVTYPVIAGWDFTGVGTTTIASLAATTFNNNLDNSTTLSNVTRGAGAAWSTAGNSFRTQGFQNNGISTANTDYFQTTLKTDLGYSLNLSNIGANFSGTASFANSPGVSSQFAYSLDGTTFTLIGSPTVTIGTPATLAIDLSGVTALQNLPSGTTVTFRYYASGQTTTGGWGFNSPSSGTNGLAFNGTIVCVDPVAYTVTGTGSLCAGGAGVAVGLSNSQLGVSYQLKRDGSNVGSLVAGTGTALAFGNQTVAGTYTVEATNVACSINLTMTGNAVVTVNPLPTLDSITATAACINTPSTVTMTGLLPNTAGSFTYTNSMTGPLVTVVSGTSDASGNFSFVTPNLPAVANGAIITITSGTVTATGCTTTFSGKTVSVVVGKVTTWTAGSPNFWDNGTPTSIDTAVIAANYSEVADVNACNLTVNNNAIVSIPSLRNVSLEGALTVSSGTFTLENNANLIQNADVNNSGSIIVKRESAPINRLDYTLWSSPVDGQMLKAFSPGTVSDRFYFFNPTSTPIGGSAGQGAFQVVPTPLSTPFAEGNGYLIRASNWFANAPAPEVNWMGTFTGVPNNGNVSLSVASGTYNAVGNPYPSTINADEFITANNLTEALYFWRKKNSSTSPSYATYTLAGGVGTAANTAGGSSVVPNGIIQVGQGFIAKATSTSLNFTNAMRNGELSTQFFRTSSIERSRVWLNLSDNNGFVNQALVAYMPSATTGIDAAIDGRFLENNIPTQLSSLINGEEFAVQGKPVFTASDVVALGFKTQTEGNYTIAIDHVDGLFANGQEVFLKDNVTNAVHNLTNEPYNFTAPAGTANTRFEIVYQSTLATQNPVLNENMVAVYKQNQNLVVNTGAIQMKDVKVYDIQGRLLVEQKDVNAATAKLAISSTNQVLIVKVTAKDSSVVTKKVLF